MIDTVEAERRTLRGITSVLLCSVLAGAAGRELIPVIGSTGLLQLAYATLLTAGLALS